MKQSNGFCTVTASKKVFDLITIIGYINVYEFYRNGVKVVACKRDRDGWLNSPTFSQ